MKKSSLILMTIALFMFGAVCLNAQTPNLDGTWIHPNQDSQNARITFSGNSFIYEWDNGSLEGTYVINKQNITFTASNKKKWSTKFALNGVSLDLEKGSGTYWWYGSFFNWDYREDRIKTLHDSIAASTTPTNLEGTWRHPGKDSQNARITFTGNSFTYQWDSRSINGRYKINGKNIEFAAADGSINWKTTFTLKDEQLSLDGGTGRFWWYGSFINHDINKKLYDSIATSTDPTNLEGTWRHGLGAYWSILGNSWKYTDGEETDNGRFKINGSNITFVSTDSSFQWTTTFKINKNVLTLNEVKGGYWYIWGNFNKIDVDGNKKIYESIAASTAPTSLEGSWKHPNKDSKNASFIFTGNSFTYQTNDGSIDGRFIINGKNVQFVTADGFINWTTPFTANANSLSLTSGTDSFGWYGTFNKSR